MAWSIGVRRLVDHCLSLGGAAGELFTEANVSLDAGETHEGQSGVHDARELFVMPDLRCVLEQA